MKIIKNPGYNELPKKEELGRLFSGIGWLDVLLFAIFLVPLVILPLAPLFISVFSMIMKLIIR